MTFTNPGELLVLLLAAHFLADYPLQGPFLSEQKNPWLDPERRAMPWWQAMTAHAFIHAGFVTLLTGSVLLGLLEYAVHFWTDHTKCEGVIDFNKDQAIHVGCKVLWFTLWWICQ